MASSPETYANWTTSELTARVIDLERQLRDAQASQKRSTNQLESPVESPKLSSTKPPREFDWGKHSTRVIALKFAYLGRNYNGFEHHANNFTPLPTVEQTIWEALMKAKLINPTGDTSGKRNALDWEGCDYSKCGRTDRGVSAFGQVIGLRVRSNRKISADKATFDDNDELCYVQTLNSLLPSDIRMLAWCPNPPGDFSARFSCRSRHYKYFFTQPCFSPTPGPHGWRNIVTEGSPASKIRRREGWLDIANMQDAARRFEGLHDFRNFCKIDGSKQIYDYRRRIFRSEIRQVMPGEIPGAYVNSPLFQETSAETAAESEQGSISQVHLAPQVYVFDLQGSAFLWHQVRHMVAVLFLVGQGLEKPQIIDDLLNIEQCPERPHYYMADDTPLVLWNCTFPGDGDDPTTDALDWRYVGEEVLVADHGRSRNLKYGVRGAVDLTWSLWREAKMDEILRGSLLGAIVKLPDHLPKELAPPGDASEPVKQSQKVFLGGNAAGYAGTYVPLLKRQRMKSAEEVNREYAEKHGLPEKMKGVQSGEVVDVRKDHRT